MKSIIVFVVVLSMKKIYMLIITSRYTKLQGTELNKYLLQM